MYLALCLPCPGMKVTECQECLSAGSTLSVWTMGEGGDKKRVCVCLAREEGRISVGAWGLLFSDAQRYMKC